ncbi:MAG: hypothetical protein ACI3ZZ_04830 [Candidatus Aphodosoma sp.]
MKKLIFILSLCITITCGAQNLTSVSKAYGHGYSVNVIQPTIENFISLCDMSESQFVSAMKAKGYFPTEDSGNPIVYWNGSTDNFAYALAVNTWEYNILSDWRSYIVKKEYIYPNNSMTDFIMSVKPYYYARKCVIYDDKPSDVFKIERNGKVYAIFITDLGEYYYVHARIFPS